MPRLCYDPILPLLSQGTGAFCPNWFICPSTAEPGPKLLPCAGPQRPLGSRAAAVSTLILTVPPTMKCKGHSLLYPDAPDCFPPQFFPPNPPPGQAEVVLKKKLFLPVACDYRCIVPHPGPPWFSPPCPAGPPPLTAESSGPPPCRNLPRVSVGGATKRGKRAPCFPRQRRPLVGRGLTTAFPPRQNERSHPPPPVTKDSHLEHLLVRLFPP